MIRGLTLAVCLAAPAALACGGFFCSGGVSGPPPVIQTGEKIIFFYENGDEVTAHVQILYQGDPRTFAWVVPVPALPALSVGSDQLFTIVDQATTPTFSTRLLNFCSSIGCSGCGSPALSGGTGTGGGFGGTGGGSGVSVISEQPVGPFDTKILSTTNPKALQEYLQQNGFDVSPSYDALIAPYVDKGNYFIALKLQSDKGTGDLQPIVIKYKSQEGPCVPLRLTAVAAQPDMGIAVYVFGKNRAVSSNYLHLTVNDAAIDWSRGGVSNYPQVVTAAADEAGGRGFVTDFAGDATFVKQQVDSAFRSYSRAAVSGTTPTAFVTQAVATGLLGGSQNVLALMRRCVPIPAGQESQGINFYLNWSSNVDLVTQTTVDQPKCGDDFDALVVEPLRSASALMGRNPKLTRLYTTMSANEMTVDPIFVLNPDLPDVAAARVLPAEMECGVGGGQAGLTYTSSDGSSFGAPLNGSTVVKGAPSLLTAEKMTDRGAGVVTLDNRGRARDANRMTVPGGCAIAGGGSLIAMLSGLFVWFASRRRQSWGAR